MTEVLHSHHQSHFSTTVSAARDPSFDQTSYYTSPYAQVKENMASGSLLPAFADPSQSGGGYQYMMDARQVEQGGSGGYAMPSGSGGSGIGSGAPMVMGGSQQPVYYATPQQQQAYNQQHFQQQQQYQQAINTAQYTHQPGPTFEAESSQGGATESSGGNGQAIVYITTYNGISVYESMIRNVAVMMRRTDRY